MKEGQMSKKLIGRFFKHGTSLLKSVIEISLKFQNQYFMKLVTINFNTKHMHAQDVWKNVDGRTQNKPFTHSLSFMERYENDSDEFSSHIVTGDET